MIENRIALRTAGQGEALAPFSLLVLVVSFVAFPALSVFGIDSFTYYGLFAFYVAALFVWMFKGDVTEDFLALSVMFVAFYVLLPEPMLADEHFYFWNAPSEFNNPSIRVLALCAVFLGSGALATLWKRPTSKNYTAAPVASMQTFVALAVAGGLMVFAALFPNVLLQTRGEVNVQIGQDGGALRQLLLVSAPRGLAGGYLIALAISACSALRQGRLPFREVIFSVPAVIFFNPVAISRQLLLTGFLALAFVLSRFRIVNRKWVLVLLPLASLVIAPAISNITRFEVRNDAFPFAPDFDVHQNIALAMQLVDIEGLRYGLHLIASLSTVLPSDLKLFQSEHLLASERVRALYSQTNISLPMFVEFFVDFGWIGVGFCTFLVFRLLRRMQEQVYYGSPSVWLFGLSVILNANWLALNRGPFLGNSPVLIFFVLGWSFCWLGLRAKRSPNLVAQGGGALAAQKIMKSESR